MKTYLIAAVALFGVICVHECSAQEDGAADQQFTLINTVPKSEGFECYIANSKTTNMLTPSGEAAGEAPGNGFTTGLIRWQPADGELVAKVPGKQVASLKPFIKAGEEPPLLILKEKSPGQPGFSLLPKAGNRETAFYDAINLTPQPDLQISIDGKNFHLPQGKRIRVSKNNIVRYEVVGGPKDLLESIDPPSHVMIFYGGDNGRVRCMVVADRAP